MRRPAPKRFQLARPRTRDRQTDLPIGFVPVYLTTTEGNGIARYRCTAKIRILDGKIRQCSWTGQKTKCASHRMHDFTLAPEDDPTFHVPAPVAPHRVTLNQTILRIAGEFVASTNLRCHSAASMPMFNFIIKLVQLRASLSRDQLNTIMDVATLIDRFSDKTIATEVHAIGEMRFQESITRLQELRFVNLIVDAGQIHQIKLIPCLLTNPYSQERQNSHQKNRSNLHLRHVI
jgi:hypothetical protein